MDKKIGLFKIMQCAAKKRITADEEIAVAV